MPLIPIVLLAGGVGFGGGFFTGQSLSGLVKLGIVLAVAFWLFAKFGGVL